MALTGQSSFTGTPDTTWKPKTAETDSQGFTMAQRRMEGARSPLNGNMENEVKPKEDPGVTTESSRAQATAGEEAKKNKPGDMQPNPLLQEAQRVGQQIGNLGYNLQASLNTLLHGATTNIGSAGQVGYTVDSTTGEVAMSPDSLSNVYDPVVQQKVQEQQQLKEAASPFSSGDQTKDFGQVLREQNEGKNTAMLMQLVESLKEYEQNGAADSPEARAMRAQLKAMDKDGLVSGLYAARNRYNKLMGQKVYGDEGDVGYDVHELSTMDTSKIEDEVQKAAEFSSGLFGGDFETSLAKMYDDQSAARQASGIREATVRNKLSSALKLILEDTASSLGKNRAAFRQALLDGSDDIVAALNKAGNTEAAQAYMSAVNAGQPVDQVLYDMLNDPESGIDTTTRKMIDKYIGNVATDTKSEFATYLSQLATNGYFTVDGNKVRPTAQQQMEIIRQAEIANNAQTQEEKDGAQAKISEIINNLQIDPSTTLNNFVSGLITKTAMKPEEMVKQLDAAEHNITTMFTTFANSQFEQEMANALGLNTADWGKMTEAQRAAAVNALYASDPRKFRDLEAKIMMEIKEAKDNVNATSEETGKKLDEALVRVGENTTKLNGAITAANNNIRTMYDTMRNNGVNVMEDSHNPSTISAISNRLKTRPDVAAWLADGRITPGFVDQMAKVYAYNDAYNRVNNTFSVLVDGLTPVPPATFGEYMNDPARLEADWNRIVKNQSRWDKIKDDPKSADNLYTKFLTLDSSFKLPPGVAANRNAMLQAVKDANNALKKNEEDKIKVDTAKTNLGVIKTKVNALGSGFNFNEVVKKAVTSPEWTTQNQITMGGGAGAGSQTYNPDTITDLQAAGPNVAQANTPSTQLSHQPKLGYGDMKQDFGGAQVGLPVIPTTPDPIIDQGDQGGEEGHTYEYTAGTRHYNDNLPDSEYTGYAGVTPSDQEYSDQYGGYLEGPDQEQDGEEGGE